MRLTPENKARVRARILRGAADLFRSAGYAAVSIDQVMAAADLTRGAFYAHFRSKEDLFAAVLRHEHPLLRMLADRPGTSPKALQTEARAILAAYLDPAHHDAVFAGCTVAALGGEASRAAPPAKAAFGAAWEAIIAELSRGQPDSDPALLHTTLILASGAVTTAAAHPPGRARAAILDAARPEALALLNRALP